MGLFRRQITRIPLELPRPFSFPVSGPVIEVVKHKRVMREATAAKASAESLVEQQPSWLVDEAKATGNALAREFAWRPRDEKEGVVFGVSVALGFALASIEGSRGWQMPGLVDARVKAAMSLALNDFPDDLADLHPLLSFALESGYWVARTGEDGLGELLSQPNLKELAHPHRDEP